MMVGFQGAGNVSFHDGVKANYGTYYIVSSHVQLAGMKPM